MESPASASSEDSLRGAANGQTVDAEPIYEIPSEEKPGTYEALKAPSKAAAVGKVVAGAVVGAAGVAMLVLPGPGIAGVAVGALLAGKGIQELTGRENPVITQVEDHPEYKAAVQTAKDAVGSVKGAVDDAMKQVPDAAVGAGKAMYEAVDSNLPPSVKEAVDTVVPVVKRAAETAGPAAKKAAEAAAPVVKAAGEELNAGVKHLASKAKDYLGH